MRRGEHQCVAVIISASHLGSAGSLQTNGFARGRCSRRLRPQRHAILGEEEIESDSIFQELFDEKDKKIIRVSQACIVAFEKVIKASKSFTRTGRPTEQVLNGIQATTFSEPPRAKVTASEVDTYLWLTLGVDAFQLYQLLEEEDDFQALYYLAYHEGFDL